MNVKFDWPEIERQYIRGDMSLRELADERGVTNISLMTRRSTRLEWVRKREEFKAKAERKALELMGTEEGRRIAREARVRDDAIELIDKAILQLSDTLDRKQKVLQGDGSTMEVPLLMVTPKDITGLIDRLQVLFGRPSTISEERSVGLNLSTSDPAVLRAIVDLTRGVAAVGSGGSPLPRIEDTGKD